jgi:ribosomal protein S8
MSFFENYVKITGKPLPDPDKMTVDEKACLVHQLRLSGESMTAIANYLGVSRQYAYMLKDKAKDQRLTELENQSYLSHFTEILHDLESTRDRHRKIVDKIKTIEENDWVDPETGEKVKKTGSLRDYAEASRLVLMYDKLIIELYFRVGFIPKEQDSLFTSLAERNPEISEDTEEELSEVDKDKLAQMVLSKIRQKRPSISNKLKELKDEKLL